MSDKKNLFNSIKVSKPNRNHFDLSHDVKLSCNMGELVPVMITPLVPGDNFRLGCESMVRFAPMLAPIMHRVDISMHYFFVSNRLVWPNWEKFITQQPLSPSQPVPAHPYVEIDEGNWNRVMDYMGIPNPMQAGAGTGELVSPIPFAAYQLVWWEWYRAQYFQNVDQNFPHLVDGSNTADLPFLTTLRKRCWEHDYLTSALPFAQAGEPVRLPLDFSGQDVLVNHNVNGGGESYWNADSTSGPANDARVQQAVTADPDIPQESLYASLQDVQGTSTLNDLRTSMAIQKWLEKKARGGARYIEMIRSFFGVRSSDKRLQRPEYIAGVKAPVMISEVLNTTGTATAAQGDMAGHGVGVVSSKYGNYYAEEHGYIIGVMSVMPKTAYMQGIPRHFSKINDAYEHFWPEFANIGEQDIKGSEVQAFFDSQYSAATWGYNPRYSEYKFENNRVAGDFRSTLDYWHMARLLQDGQELNEQFLEADPTHRIFANEDPSDQKLWCHVFNKVSAIRPMPKYGTPTF